MPFSRVPNWIIDSGVYAELSPAAARLLPILGRRLKAKSDDGAVTVEVMCELSGLKKTAVYKALSELEKREIVCRDYGKPTFSFRDGGKSDSAYAENDSAMAERVSATAESHPYSSRTSFKNTLKNDPVCVPLVPYPHRDNGTIPVREAAERLFDSVNWPKARRGGEGGVRLLSDVLLRLADGWGEEAAKSDPVSWIQVRMMARVRDAESKRFVPAFAKWVRDEYPHLAQQEQPA